MHPTIFTIFGITGDLANRKLIPALIGLYSKKMLPQRFAVIGFSRRPFSREEFREFIRGKMNLKPGQFKEEDIKHFLDHMTYEQGLFDDSEAYSNLARAIKKIDDQWGQCSNKIFHLSVPPVLYEGILNKLAGSKLNIPCSDNTGWTRVLIEKPFGNDTATAKSLDKLLGKLFKEEQIFRIDHYLAKEALQNILAFRFANSIFEPLWNREFIEKVHIRLSQRESLEGRGAFYDPIGAIKDVGQNHLLQMLALVAMDKPRSFMADDIRRERVRVLAWLSPIKPRKIESRVVLGQYEGYTLESGVSPQSRTETYFRIQSFINSKRWKGVPFYLESGKALGETRTSIDVYFRSAKSKVKSQKFFGHTADSSNQEFNGQNILTFRIQPDEGIKIRFFVKTPGYGFMAEPKTLKFNYSDIQSFNSMPNDYERLIHDAFVGDQTLFASTDEILASWKFVMPILENLGRAQFKRYPKGTREVR